MEKIKVSKHVISKLDALTIILIEKDYFSIEDNAIEYVKKIFSFIYSIPKITSFRCKKNTFGDFHAKLKMNRHTTYYNTYDHDGDLYLIKNLFTNHESGYVNFIK
jgi:hypothetical protein